MARQARGTVYAGTYHVIRRSAGPIPMYRDDLDRTNFCNRLGGTIRRFKWRCHAFCLMTTHYHLLLDVDENALQPGMKVLNGPYAQEFNRRWRRSGHLRSGPYRCKRVEGVRQFVRTVRYIARNPVKAGLCGRPADWPWSSYRGSAGYAQQFWFVDDDLVLATLHEDRTEAQRLLRGICET
jgi:putative transposase